MEEEEQEEEEEEEEEVGYAYAEAEVEGRHSSDFLSLVQYILLTSCVLVFNS